MDNNRQIIIQLEAIRKYKLIISEGNMTSHTNINAYITRVVVTIVTSHHSNVVKGSKSIQFCKFKD